MACFGAVADGEVVDPYAAPNARWWRWVRLAVAYLELVNGALALLLGLALFGYAMVHKDHGSPYVMLGGVRIAHTHGLTAHSDGDVVLHALTDAVLGALGEGDIGQHFPPSDPKWKGAASHLFLEDAVKRVTNRGGRIANADVTLLCEAPKIGPHRDAMKCSIAQIMGLDPARVGIKATTTEGLGFTGRREGIAAMACVMLLLP